MGWNDVGMSAGGKDYLKLTDKEKVKLHIIGESLGGPAEPKSFYQFFNQTVNRGAVIGDDYTGQVDKRAQHAFVVWSFRDNAFKIWAMGNKLAAQIKGLMEAYDGSLDTVDIILQRSGTGKTTTYIPTAVPTKFDDSMIEGQTIPDLEIVLAPGSEEEIENLKNGIVTDSDDAPAEDVDADATTETAAEETEAEAVAEEPEDEEAALVAQMAALKAKKAAAAGKGGTATKAAPAKGVSVGDPRLQLVKQITHAFAANAKYKTPTARMAAIKSIAKGKTTLSQLSVAELTILKGKIK